MKAIVIIFLAISLTGFSKTHRKDTYAKVKAEWQLCQVKGLSDDLGYTKLPKDTPVCGLKKRDEVISDTHIKRFTGVAKVFENEDKTREIREHYNLMKINTVIIIKDEK